MKAFLAHPDRREKLYNLFKYTIYLLLIGNTFLFFREDWAASSHTFQGGVSVAEIITAFTASIDTLNWVILLLLFELETWVLSDEALKSNRLKWSLMAVRGICYSLIVYALYGYIRKLMPFYDVTSFPVEDICAFVDGSLSRVNTLDEYALLSAENCGSLRGMELFRMAEQNMVVEAATLSEVRALASIDVVNASTWLGVVVTLELDVWFQTRELLEGLVLKVSKAVKAVLYSTLLGCALLWGYLGGYLDFWDAFLWLLAFAFIEMNLFQWQQEVKEEQEAKEHDIKAQKTGV